MIVLGLLLSVALFCTDPHTTVEKTGDTIPVLYDFSNPLTQEYRPGIEEEFIPELVKKIESIGLRYQLHSFDEAVGFHSFSRILVVERPGSGNDLLTLVVPLTPPVTHTDGVWGTGISIAVELLESLKNREIESGLRVLFLGGEYEDHLLAPLGSRYYLSLHSPVPISPVIYLNLSQPPERISLDYRGSAAKSPRLLVERVWRLLNGSGLPVRLQGSNIEAFEFGLGDTKSVIDPYLKEGYPALLLEGEGSLDLLSWDEWKARMVAVFTGLLERAGERTDDWDTHYLVLEFGTKQLIVPERIYLICLLVVAAIMIAYPFFAIRRFRRYYRTLLHHLWMIPLLVLGIYFYLFIGTLAIEGVMVARKMPDMWKATPLSLYLLKLLVGVVCYLPIMPLYRVLPIKIKGSFFPVAALFMLMVDMIVIAAINISYSYFFLSFLIVIFVVSIIRNRLVKAAGVVFAVAWVGVLLYNIFANSQEGLIQLLLVSRLGGNLLQAMVLLPVILLLSMMGYRFFVPSRRVRRIMIHSGILTLSGVFVTMLIYIVTLDPYRGTIPQPLKAVERIDAQSRMATLSLDSPAQLSERVTWYNGTRIALRKGTVPIRFSSGLRPSPPSLQIITSSLLRRREISLTLFSRESGHLPSHVELELSSPAELVILDANFPYTLPGEFGDRASVHIGQNPPLPLTIFLVVPQDTTISGRFQIEYDLPQLSYDDGERNYLVSRSRIYQEEFFISPVE